MSAAPATERPERGDESRRGRRSTIAAFLANLGIAVAKFVVFLLTGAASMLAESVHSLADTANQGLLLFGRRRSRQRPNPHHPFGYGRERYFWAFVVAMVLFSGGALFALVEGEEKLRTPHELSSYPWALGVLLVAAVLEATSLRTAVRESRAERERGESWPAFIRRSRVPEISVVLLEDTGALLGLFLALTGITLAEVTGNPRYYALGSLGIGVLLAVIAFTLATEMKSLLIGEAAAPDQVAAIRECLEHQPQVRSVEDLRTEQLGPGAVLVVASAVFDAEGAGELTEAIAAAEGAIRDEVPDVRFAFLEPVDAAPARTA